MSQRFFHQIQQGETAGVAAAVDEDASLACAKDAQGLSALLWAIYQRQPLIRDFLLSRLPKLDIFEAAAVGDCAQLERFLRGDALLVHQTSVDGWSPLHLAAAFGGAGAVALLLEHGAHVHRISRNALRSQPLHSCLALSGDVETARLLIAQGADVNAVQAGGYTPLHQAAVLGKSDLIFLLLEAGAEVGALCDRGKTAEQYARERGRNEAAGILAGRPRPENNAVRL